MTNYKLTVAFKGTRYHGWQVQNNALSVCEAFQDAIERAFGKRFEIKGCSRTDAGVHANGFVISMKMDNDYPDRSVTAALNVCMPQDIAVLKTEHVPEDFHPRYDCISKRYVYKLLDSPTKNPFWEGLALHCRQRIDLQRCNEAALHFIGEHDFSAFCAAGSSILPEERTRTVYKCGLSRQGDIVSLAIEGNGFLYNMVRIITGTLLEVSFGKREPSEIPDIIKSKDRARAGVTAPAYGLYLDSVTYPQSGRSDDAR